MSFDYDLFVNCAASRRAIQVLKITLIRLKIQPNVHLCGEIEGVLQKMANWYIMSCDPEEISAKIRYTIVCGVNLSVAEKICFFNYPNGKK